MFQVCDWNYPLICFNKLCHTIKAMITQRLPNNPRYRSIMHFTAGCFLLSNDLLWVFKTCIQPLLATSFGHIRARVLWKLGRWWPGCRWVGRWLPGTNRSAARSPGTWARGLQEETSPGLQTWCPTGWSAFTLTLGRDGRIHSHKATLGIVPYGWIWDA